jgi:hypothetical protein
MKRILKIYTFRDQQGIHPPFLWLLAEDSSEWPRSITNVEKFSKTPFDDLWQEAITPRYKLDRSYGDTLEASHIK